MVRDALAELPLDSNDYNCGHLGKLPLAQVKSKFSEMVDRVEQTQDRIVVTRNGRPAAVTISPDDLASLEDTLELLSDSAAMQEIADAKRAHEEGDFVSASDLRKRYRK